MTAEASRRVIADPLVRNAWQGIQTRFEYEGGLKLSLATSSAKASEHVIADPSGLG